MEQEQIVIKGAREHNLKNIDVTIPRNRLTVLTGLSGSGKSSLAFDTIYAEGQRRYVESLSSYARQFLEQLQKPNVDLIQGLSPAISIEQRHAGGNPRSTVGTQTEVYDYLRLLFAKVGTPFCPKCGAAISRQSAQEIVERIGSAAPGRALVIMAPLVRGRKGEYRELFEQVRKDGFVRVRVDGIVRDLDDQIDLDKKKKHTIEVVVDRLGPGIDRRRLTESVETALKAGKGTVVVRIGEEEMVFSEQYACARCGTSIGEISPRVFSFNSPYGACPACDGLGNKREIDPELVTPDRSKPVIEAIAPWRYTGHGMLLYYRRQLRSLAYRLGFDVHTPFDQLSAKLRQSILYGCQTGRGEFEGVIPNLERRFVETDSEFVKAEINKFMSESPCPACKGARLRPESLSVRIAQKNIVDTTTMPIKEALDFFATLPLTGEQKRIAHQILKEIVSRLSFMKNVGLDYLTLERKSSTLSGGEAQRIRLATQIGSGLVGVLYVLDEPSIGLHQRDNLKLLDTLKALRDLGNTLVVVEHDEATIRMADHVIDLGPGAGEYGGRVIAEGTIDDIIRSPESLTGKYLRGEHVIPVPARRRQVVPGRTLTITGAREHNLKGIDVTLPLGLFVCVTGVSGSGKSTLVDDILYTSLSRRLFRSKVRPGKHTRITGVQHIDKVIEIDQSPIGRTPRSNPATYVEAFSPIRDLFSRVPEARARGYKPGRFSFNVKGGRCEACTGEGVRQIEMHFLSDVYVTCEVCKGARYNAATLEVRYKGRSIKDVLDMSVDDAVSFFENIPPVAMKLRTLSEVGLGYIRLGQPATTLSGGEAQRVKLAAELSKAGTGKTLYILDEPTTGLHFADTDKLLSVLQRLVSRGNTVLVIEHNLDVIKTADYLIDLGPEGGDEGGYLVAAGTPEEIVKNPASHTGRYLKKILETSPRKE